MTPFTEAYDFSGRTVVDREGDKIGTVDDVFADRDGGRPEWALVHTGLLGTSRSFVPLRGASPSGENVRVMVAKQAVKDSPSVEANQELSETEERRLFEHYGVPYATEGSTTAREVHAASTEAGRHEVRSDDVAEPSSASETAVGRDVSDPRTDDAMTRSEEELRVGTREREAGRVRLRKYVVTEYVRQTVPVQRERVRIEHEPITDADVDQASAGPKISEEEHEIVLHEEELVIEKRVVPKERVRLAKDVVTEEQAVNEEVRKERIDVEDTTRQGDA